MNSIGLKLTQVEVDVLYEVLGMISGSPKDSFRGITNQIYNVLQGHVSDDSVREIIQDAMNNEIDFSNCHEASILLQDTKPLPSEWQ